MVGGMTRDQNDVFLALHAGLSQCFRKMGANLSDGILMLEAVHGTAYQLYGERLQHTDKLMPVRFSNSVAWSKNIFPRVRSIWMAPKFSVIWNKKSANRFIQVFLKCPFHEQDRVKTRKQFSQLLTTHDAFAVDVSGFDRSHGGARGRQILGLACSLNSTSNYDDILTEWMIPGLSFYNSRPILIKDMPILWSGFSHTTALGTIANSVAFVSAMSNYLGCSPSSVVSKVQNGDLFYFAWGDDIVIFLRKNLRASMVDIKKSYLKACSLEVDPEPVVRFLGTNYDRGSYAGTMDQGYPLGRFVQQQFFPERGKLWPFSEVGYWARLQLLDDSKRSEVHNLMIKYFWDEAVLGPKTPLSQWTSRLPLLNEQIEKFSFKISQLDDVLQMLSHGLDFDSSSTGVDELDSFLQGIPSLSVDVSKPIDILDRQSKSLKFMTPLLDNLSKGRFDPYRLSLSVLANEFKMSFSRGSEFY
jgi:hypothetical protein